MTPTFASSSLVQLFSHWTPPKAPTTGVDLAARLGQWVSAFDAIGLHADLREVRAMGAAPAAARAGAGAGAARSKVSPAQLATAFATTRQTLARAIAQPPALPDETTYAPYKRRHQELQREMDKAVTTLREQVRAVLMHMAPPLRQLAALDSALAKVVAQREQAVLPVAVTLLGQRFALLQKAHLKARHAAQAAGSPEAADDPSLWRQPGGWLHLFETDWRQALHAELALRLQPVAGLIEATGIDLNHSP